MSEPKKFFEPCGLGCANKRYGSQEALDAHHQGHVEEIRKTLYANVHPDAQKRMSPEAHHERLSKILKRGRRR